MKKKRIFLLAAILVAMTMASSAQDIIKLKVLDRAMKCRIVQTGDSIIVYQKYNSEQILMAKTQDIDWYILEDGTRMNISGKEIKQSDVENAYEYKPSIQPDTISVYAYDYIKLKAFSRAIACQIMNINDFAISYKQVNNSKNFIARIKDVDWYQLHTGKGRRCSGKMFARADIDNAYIYPGLQMDADMADSLVSEQDTLPIIENNLKRPSDYLPYDTIIAAYPKNVYAAAAEQLITAGYMITESDDQLMCITTDYTNYTPGFFKDLVIGGLFGEENIMSAITLLVIPISQDSCRLVIRGKVRFTQRPGILEKALVQGITGRLPDKKEDQINWVIGRGTDLFKILESIGGRIKDVSEGKNPVESQIIRR